MKTLRKFWQAWQRFGRFMGTIVAHVALTVFYFSLFLPNAVVMTWFSDPLLIRQPKPTWAARQAGDPSIEAARRQF